MTKHHGLVLSVLIVSVTYAQPAQVQPRAVVLVEALHAEMVQSLARRNVRPAFDQYQTYVSALLDASAGAKRFADKTGNCRLAWYDKLLRNQLDAPLEAERFSRHLHEALRGDHRGLARALDMVAVKLDMIPVAIDERPAAPDGQAALVQLEGAIGAARSAYEAALAPLSEEQRENLRRFIYAVNTGQVTGSAAFTPDRAGGRRICDLLEAMDRTALHTAAKALAPLTDVHFLAQLARLPARRSDQPAGVQGKLHAVVQTPLGTILIGGVGDNVYDLDTLDNVCAVVDLGGQDIYKEGVVSAARPVLVLIDLAGDDKYLGVKPGIQGAAVCGVSMLLDVGGDDIYDAQDVAQGATLAGVGLLIDFAGNDSYRGLRRAQGSAMGGIAILIDRAGNDAYHAALYAQGFGGPLGCGVLDDLDGADHYYAGGLYPDGYNDTPGYAGWSQGVGAGPRGTANGGVGVLLDGGGDDIYEADYFSHGGGYWFAVGIARDFAGNDQRLGSTRLAYDGSKRKEEVFLRWGIGWQAHYALGFVIDDQGNDTYGGNIVGLAFSWDIGLAALLDFAGNDQYQIAGQGQGHQAAMGIIFDADGDDHYVGSATGNAPASISYHPLPASGGNFAFGIDYGGHDTRAAEPHNDADLEVGSRHGFLIDRAQVPMP